MTRRLLLAATPLLLLGACHSKSPEEAVEPEYADWYVLKAPETRAIEAVYGDIDGTLLITTRFNIYRTTDRGKTWQVSRPSNLGIFGFLAHRDTLFTLTAGLGSLVDSTTVYAAHPTHYSADQGRTWLPYQYTGGTSALSDTKVPINRVRTPAGVAYRIAIEQKTVAPGSTYLLTRGIQGTTGPLLTLPQAHQLNSIYLDKKARLYVAASAPLCGGDQQFAYCGAQNGLLYVSKNPLP